MFPNNFYNSDYYGAWGGASEDPQSNQNLPQYGVSGTGMGAYSTGFPSHQQPQGGSFSSSAREIYNALPASHYPYGSFEARSPEVDYEALVNSPERIDLDSVLQGKASLSQSVQQNIHGELGSISHGGSRWMSGIPQFDQSSSSTGTHHRAQEGSSGPSFEPEEQIQEVGQSSRGFMPGRHSLGLESDSQSREGGAEQAENPQNPTDRAFMNALPHYASGMKVRECGRLSKLKAISSYFGNLGLQRDGVRIYNNLSQPMKERVEAAIEARRKVLFGERGLSPRQEGFLRALEPFALGESISECEKQANWTWMRSFVSSKGVLTARGKKLLDSLPTDFLPEVNDALTARQTWYAKSKLMTYHFFTAMELFARTKCSVEEISSRVGGLERGLLGLVLCDAGLTDVGQRYVHEVLPPEQRGFVDHYIARRLQG